MPDPQAQLVGIKAPDGKILEVPEPDVAQAVAAGGEVISRKHLEQARLEKKYGGLGAGLAAASIGAGQGLSFGLAAPVAFKAIGALEGPQAEEDARKATAELVRARGGAYATGEVGGIAAPLLLSGGTSGLAGAAAKGAEFTAPSLIAKAGGAVARGTESLLGQGAERAAARVAQRVAPKIAGMAAEGTLYGAGDAISDATINDHELMSEKLLAHMGQGALYGSLLGGGGALAGEALGAGARIAKEAVGESQLKKIGDRPLSEVLNDEAGGFAWRSTGGGPGRARLTREAEHAGGFKEVGKQWIKEAPEVMGKPFGKMTQEDMGPYASMGLAKHGQDTGRIVDAVDETAQELGKRPRALDVMGDIDNVVAKLASDPAGAEAENAMRAFSMRTKAIHGLLDEDGYIGPWAKDQEMSLRELRDLRVAADKKSNWTTPEMAPVHRAFAEVRDNLEKRLTSKIEELADGQTLAEYRKAKKGYQAFKLLDKAAKISQTAQGANNFFSLGDQIKSVVGGGIGSALGGPLTGMGGAILGSITGKLIRSRGDFVAADLLGKMSKLATMERVGGSVDQRIAGGVKAFFENRPLSSTEARHPRKVYEALAQSVLAAKGNPSRMQVHVERAIGDIGPMAPNVSMALATKVAGQLGYLSDRVPVPRSNVISITAARAKQRISEAELDKIHNIMAGLSDPLSVLDDLRRGKMNRDKISAMRANFPRLFQQIQTEIIKQAATIQKELPYAKRNKLDILFGAPVDDSHQPDFVRRIQQIKLPEPTKAQGGGGHRGHRMKMDTDLYSTPLEMLGGRK